MSTRVKDESGALIFGQDEWISTNYCDPDTPEHLLGRVNAIRGRRVYAHEGYGHYEASCSVTVPCSTRQVESALTWCEQLAAERVRLASMKANEAYAKLASKR